ncbi:hypothetical protein SISSUDRAFT_1065206 [Sistotremastrum suecicum HHB10207 ss-3]|uniref:Uncharacterized protein n=1 Tax=Sistotremastrum suecicum HHB10207 ss-3 TaxID=1314776 RepID=A0A165ZRD4_9AGAM|nr:hypothetical protein SISSUDRAFT_1065206 [Sistotremastrum suecicum HHB10207 ss-3]
MDLSPAVVKSEEDEAAFLVLLRTGHITDGSPDNPITISDSEDDSPKATTRPTTKSLPSSSQTAATRSSSPISIQSDDSAAIPDQPRVKITRQLSVSILRTLTEPMRCWPHDDVGYLLTVDPATLKNDKGDVISVDHLIKNQDRDSWKGGTGFHDTHVNVDFPGVGSLQCRRARLSCNGIFTCSQVDPGLLKKYERVQPDADEYTRFVGLSQEARAREGTSLLQTTVTYFNVVRELKCPRKDNDGHICGGSARIQSYREPRQGRNFFIGCTKYKRDQAHQMEKDHLHQFLPSNVDQPVLARLFGGAVIQDVSGLLEKPCAVLESPLVGYSRKHCPLTHMKDGRPFTSPMVHRPCPARRFIFVPTDPRYSHMAIVVAQLSAGAHNHPMHPERKLTYADKALYAKSVDAIGAAWATVTKVDNAPSTRAYFGTSTLAEKSPAFLDNRKKADIITKKRKSEFPDGIGSAVSVYRMFEEQQTLATADRYIHAVHSSAGSTFIFMSMPYLCKFLHTVPWVMIDTTFKTICGEYNEWEWTIWLPHINQVIAPFRVITNKADTAAYEHMFRTTFETIQTITGRALEFQCLNPSGTLRTIHMDFEAAQALGLGAEMVRQNDPQISGLSNPTAVYLITCVLILCQVHFSRGLNPLAKACTPADYARLKSITSLTSSEDVRKWKDWCREHPVPAVRQWFMNKEMHSWALPCFSRFLSNVPKEVWDLAPPNTNMNEAQHAWKNHIIDTGHPLAAAVLAMQGLDKEVARQIQISEKSDVQRNANNTFAHRLRKGIGRQMTSQAHKTDARNKKTAEAALKQLADQEKENQEASKARLKEIQSKMGQLRESGALTSDIGAFVAREVLESAQRNNASTSASSNEALQVPPPSTLYLPSSQAQYHTPVPTSQPAAYASTYLTPQFSSTPQFFADIGLPPSTAPAALNSGPLFGNPSYDYSPAYDWNSAPNASYQPGSSRYDGGWQY